jgi:hypothetical protein
MTVRCKHVNKNGIVCGLPQSHAPLTRHQNGLICKPWDDSEGSYPEEKSETEEEKKEIEETKMKDVVIRLPKVDIIIRKR